MFHALNFWNTNLLNRTASIFGSSTIKSLWSLILFKLLSNLFNSTLRDQNYRFLIVFRVCRDNARVLLLYILKSGCTKIKRRACGSDARAARARSAPPRSSTTCGGASRGSRSSARVWSSALARCRLLSFACTA